MLDCFSELNLLKGEFKNSLVFHIPHSSTHFPNYEGYVLDVLDKEIALQTDWATEMIFNVPETKKIVANFSRLFCDVERFIDNDQESMYKFGRGFFNTKTHDGNTLRLYSEANEKVCKEYYKNHHEILSNLASESLDRNGVVHIIDCHSFCNTPLPFEDNSQPRADICLGTDSTHTPNYLLSKIYTFFTNNGFTVNVNYPYSGCIIPTEFIDKKVNVFGIMIEINKRLYMKDNVINYKSVNTLNELIVKCFDC